MCLVLLALHADPDYPLVIAANRDERHERHAEPLHWWPDRPEWAGGRDIEAGGTWMAVRRDGRFAALLNDARASAPAGAPSRGELVPRFLAGEELGAAIADIHARARHYAGFHFVAGEIGRAWIGGGDAAAARALDPGVHAIDNHGLDSGGARLQRGRALFTATLGQRPAPDVLLRVLADERDPGPGTGDMRPVFVRGERFGTRCSTVLRVDADGGADLIERRFDADGVACGERHLEWAVALAAG